MDLTYTARNQVSTQTRYSDLAGTTLVGTSTFGYDAVGNQTRLQQKDGAGSNIANYTYTYDAANRVTSEKLNGGAEYHLPLRPTNQLTSDGVNSYTYDANGNRTMAGYITGSTTVCSMTGYTRTPTTTRATSPRRARVRCLRPGRTGITPA